VKRIGGKTMNNESQKNFFELLGKLSKADNPLFEVIAVDLMKGFLKAQSEKSNDEETLSCKEVVRKNKDDIKALGEKFDILEREFNLFRKSLEIETVKPLKEALTDLKTDLKSLTEFKESIRNDFNMTIDSLKEATETYIKNEIAAIKEDLTNQLETFRSDAKNYLRSEVESFKDAALKSFELEIASLNTDVEQIKASRPEQAETPKKPAKKGRSKVSNV
jgi:hypothetical protein